MGFASDPAAPSTLLVGRRQELAALADAMGAAPSLAVVEGEAGVGKTRLIEEALAQTDIDDLNVLVGGCRPLRDPFPMGAIVQALSRAGNALDGRDLPRLLGALVPLLPELEEILPPALESLGDKAGDRHRVFRAVRALLEILGPTVLVLEDVHWADDQTAELAAYLLSEPPPELRLVISSRRDDVIGSFVVPHHGLASQSTVRLKPLTREDVAGLTEHLLSADGVSEEFAGYLHDRTTGLPFAVEQLVGSLRGSGYIVHQDGQWMRATIDELPVPSSVKAIVMQQITGLTPTARRLAEAMAVIDRPAEETFLRSIVGGSSHETTLGLADLMAARLVDHTAAGYRLRHPLAREAVYHHLPDPQRTQLHLQVGDRLRDAVDPLPLAELVHHFRAAGSTEQWMRFSEEAADLARNLGNDAEATNLCSDLLTSAALPMQSRARIASKLADSAVHAVAHAEAVPLLDDVLTDDGLPAESRGELRFALGRLLVQAGRLDEAETAYAECLADLGDRPELAAPAMSSIAMLNIVQGKGDPDEQLHWLELASSEAHRSGDETIIITVEVDRASVLLERGDPHGWAAVKQIERVGSLLSVRRQQLRGYSNLAYVSTRLGYDEMAREFLESARKLVDEGVSQRLEDALESTAILLAYRDGSWDGLLERAERFTGTPPNVLFEGFPVRYVVGTLQLAEGDARRAEAAFTALAQDAREAGYADVIPAANAALSRLALARGRREEATRVAEQALGFVRDHGKWLDLSDVAVPTVRALLANGGRAEAEAFVKQAADALDTRDAPAAVAAVMTSEALLADLAKGHDNAVDLLARAEHAWSDLGRPYDACQVAELSALAMLEAGDQAGPKALLDVLDRYERLGAQWDSDRVRQTARQHSIPLIHRRGRKPYGTTLSPRERQVAELAARGLTNREIADELFLSPRTAGDHVVRVMRKLGVPTRRDLAERLTPSQVENS